MQSERLLKARGYRKPGLPSGGSTSTNEFKPPEYTQQPWKDYIGNAQQLAGTALTPYGGQTVADLTPMTGSGLQMLSDFTTQGTPERAAGGQAIVNAATGASKNPYAGTNPYLDAMIKNSNAQITDQYRTGTSADTNAQYARSGAFGGSGWQDKVRQNEQTLAGQIGANTNNLLGQNYTQSANLAESGLNRQLTVANIGLGQQGADQSAIQAMLAGGAIPQQYQQQLLDAAKGLYTQNQQYPFTLSDFLGSALSRASGGQGTQTFTQPGMSPVTGLLGAGALGYGLMGG